MTSELTPEALQRLADEDLMTLVERKDADAFAVLYDRHGGAAYSLAHRIVGDPAVAEDVTQEAFLSRLAQRRPLRRRPRQRPLLDARDRPQPGDRRAARERRARRRSSTSTTRRRSRAGLGASSPTPRRSGARRRAACAARSASCRDEQSEVIGLAYFGGFTHSEIAEMLGMPLGTVKGRMRLGLEKIRTTLAERMGIGGPSEVLP